MMKPVFFLLMGLFPLSLRAQTAQEHPFAQHFFIQAAYSGVGNLSGADYQNRSLLLHSGVSLHKRWYAGAQARFHTRLEKEFTAVHSYMLGPFVRYYPIVKPSWRLAIDAFCLFGNDQKINNPNGPLYAEKPGQTLPGMSFQADIRLFRFLYLCPAFHYNIAGVFDMDNQISIGLLVQLPHKR
jgi:hypothetical protein